MASAREPRRRLADLLPPTTRRRLGRIKRAILDQPEPPLGRRSRKKAAAASVRPASTADPVPGVSRKEMRQQHVFANTSRSGTFLEIGPAHNGTLPRRDGFDTRIVDYLDRAGLVDKYVEFEQYDPYDIEDVDYVLAAGAPLSRDIDARFDIVLASHVLEHTTSLVDFLNECASLLKPDGEVALIVPDHRFCFDRFRERASLARVIDAHLNPPAVHTPGTLAEFSLNAVRHGGTGSWEPGHRGKYSFIHDLDRAKAKLKQARGPTYIDVHNWIFSPNHLRLLLQDLHDLDLIKIRETYFHPTVRHEFFVNLAVDGPGSGLTREELVVLADEEKRTLDAAKFATSQGQTPR